MLDQQIKSIPKKVIWCKKCTMSNQRPRIIFDSNNICSACNNYDYKNTIDWEDREKELLKLLDEYRSTNGNWDVIVPSSGGKDSGFVAHTLKYKYNMNPLLITWSPLKYTNIGMQNFDSLNDSGFNAIRCSQNGILHSKLARLCLEELGDAFHVFVLGQCYFPIHMALNLNIKLIFYGENGEVEYAGDPKQKDKPYVNLTDDNNWLKGYLKGTTIDELIEYGKDKKKYLKETKINNSDLYFYKPPSLDLMINKGITKIHHLGHYKYWHPQSNYYYCSENTGFKPNPERTEGTYSKYASIDDKFDGFHYYMRYIKFGLGRCSEDTAHEIRDGHINREEGIGLMKQFEGEYPKKYEREFLNYLGIDNNELNQIIDSWRFEHLWKKKNNLWSLKEPIT